MNQFEDFDDTMDEQSEPQTMSLMGGIAGGGALPGGEFSTTQSGDSKKLAQQSVIIGLTVTVVAFGALMGMRMTQSDASASAISAESQQFMDTLEVKIANLGNMADDDPLKPGNFKDMLRDTAAIVAAIEDDPTVKQVPLDQVQMNPFLPMNEKEVKVVTVDTAAQQEAARMVKLQDLYGELARVEIQSLVGGTRPRAFIGGDLYKLGDEIGSFIIKDIDNRRIIFAAKGFELRDGETPFALGMSRGQ